ncbi:MAG: hypothetical protein ACE5GB_12360 [Acidimicrobiales bacterium]
MTPGELLVRTDSLMAGYSKRPDATAAAIDADGWYHTGDEVRFRDDGNMVFVGRLSDMFKSGGCNVYPREIELCLEDHPAVALAAVVGVADEVFDEVGRAHLLLDHPVSTDEPLDHCRTHLANYGPTWPIPDPPGQLRTHRANYKVPKRIILHDTLPMLAVSKIDKVALRRIPV